MPLLLAFARIRRNIFILLSSSAVATLITFGTVALNARALGTDGLGFITLMQNYVALISGFFAIGTQQPVIRLGSQFIHDDERHKLPKVLALGFVIDAAASVLAGTVALALLSVFFPPTPEHQGLKFYVALYSMTLFLSGVGTLTGIMRLFDEFKYIGILLVLHAALNFIASAVLFLTGGELKNYVQLYAIALAIYNLAYIGVGLCILRRNGIAVSRKSLSTVSRAEAIEFATYCRTTWATSTIDAARNRLDVLVLGMFAGVAAAGVYGVARQLTGALNKLGSALTSAVYPEVAQLGASRNDAAAFELWMRLASVGLVVGLSATALVHFLGSFILKIGFGEAFETGSTALTVLFLSSSLILSASTFGGFIQVFVSPQKVLDVFIISALIALPGMVALIIYFGVTGAAAGQLTFSVLLYVLSWLTLRRRFARHRINNDQG